MANFLLLTFNFNKSVRIVITSPKFYLSYLAEPIAHKYRYDHEIFGIKFLLILGKY